MTHVKLNLSRYIGQSAALRFVPPDDQRRLSKSISLLLVLGKLPVPGRPTIWITVGQWPTAGVLCCASLQINIQTFSVEFFRSLVDHCRIIILYRNISTTIVFFVVLVLPTLMSANPVKISDRGVFYGVYVLASVIYDGTS